MVDTFVHVVSHAPGEGNERTTVAHEPHWPVRLEIGGFITKIVIEMKSTVNTKTDSMMSVILDVMTKTVLALLIKKHGP